ncbi:MAG: thioredoxin family protein [Caulobacterales bacterium]
MAVARRRVALGLAAAALLALAACNGASLAPRVHVATLKELPRPLPLPYDETATPADVDARIDAAFQRAGRTDKRVIVDLGGNWCGWCKALAAVMDRPEVQPFVDANFEVVPVSVSSAQGLTDHNIQVLRRFHIDRIRGVPWLTVADPDGRVLSSSPEVTDDNHQTPQQMVDWLAKWAKRPAQPG